jgi:hypothetical protein
MEPQKGKYSKIRTRRGNVQIGRLKGKSNLQIARNMQSLVNLKASRQSVKKFKAAEKLALERQKRRIRR